MVGQRLPDGFHFTGPPGSYWRSEHGWWECCTPNGRLGNLSKHTVVEHDDGTITVSPSILVHERPAHGDVNERPGWHGYLEKGVWRSC